MMPVIRAIGPQYTALIARQESKISVETVFDARRIKAAGLQPCNG